MILSDLGTIVTGKTPPTKKSEYWNGDIPFVTPKDIQGTKHIFFTERGITSIGLNSVKSSALPAGAVCVSCIGNIGYVGKTISSCVSNQQINSIIPSENVNPDYVYYLIKWLWPYFKNYEGQSTALSILNKSQFSKIEVPYHSKQQQDDIVAILNNIDDKIELNNAINNNLEQQAEAIFQSILSNAITTVNLGEIADVKGGKRLPKGVNLIDIPNVHPYIRVRDLNNVLFASLTPDYAYVDEETHKSISRYIVSTGDVLISIVGTIGLTAIVDSTLDKANLTENCVKVTNLKHITPEYLLLYLRSQLGREAITKGTVGAVQQKLPIKNIQAIPIPLLSEKDKNTLFCTLDSIFAEISSNVIQSAKLSSLRDTLLPRLMSGELDVSNIEL